MQSGSLTLDLHGDAAAIMERRGMDLPNRSSRHWLIIKICDL